MAFGPGKRQAGHPADTVDVSTAHNAPMLADTIADLVPAALAVAISPLPIAAIVLVLGAPTAKRSGLAFALAWMVGLIVASAIVVLIAIDAEVDDSPTSIATYAARVVFGLVLLVLAARKWRTRDSTDEPGWMAGLANVSPAGGLKLGLLLSAANPKNLVLALAAGASIAQAGLTVSEKAIAVGAFAVIGSLTVVGPVALYLLDADRAATTLASVKRFMVENSPVILMIVMLLLGAKLIADGIAGLLS